MFLRESYSVHATLNADESYAGVNFGFVFCHMQAEHELRVAQTEFDRQAEVTRLLLEGISSTHVSRFYMHAALTHATHLSRSVGLNSMTLCKQVTLN